MTINQEVYDYIICGAGSAGCVLAARLSQNGRHRILLLEAGGEDRSFWLTVPMGYAKLFADPRVNWMFESEPEIGLNNRCLYHPRGKVMGGTSSINGLVYIRGHRDDYDGWARDGAVGWSYADVLPYFKKAEDQQRGADQYHGVGGPLAVSDQPGRSVVAEAIVLAASQAGIPYNPDFNGALQEGAGYYQTTSRAHRRASTSQAYLKSAGKRPNLDVLTRAHATRVLFDGTIANGVEYQRYGVLHRARARGEIIVSGGTFGSPQLLQLSGIGPAAHLASLGIAVTHDSPAVGSNLRDHFYASIAYRCNRPVSLNQFSRSRTRQLMAGIQYIIFKRGVLSSNGMHAGIFTRSQFASLRPDIQINSAIWSVQKRSVSGMTMHPFPGFTMSPVHLKPKSSGSVRIKSQDAFSAPAIVNNFLTDESDVDAMIAGIRIIRQIAHQPILASLIAEEVGPASGAESDLELEGFLRTYGMANMHPVGTCRMGSHRDCVVDSNLRVRGVQNLRVADASVMPSVPAGNTNAPTIMIAEKASDLIIEDSDKYS